MERTHSGQRGFTLVEVLLACFVIGMGLVATVFSLGIGMQGVEVGRQQSTAAFLAEQRLEQVKARALVSFANVTAANFPAEGYGAIPNAPAYRRTTTITPNPGGLANTVRVDVAVFWWQVGGSGTGERRVDLSALLSNR
jgi:prepilin-type N-terminal cleavage/methylation domain-containing protein